MLLGRVMPHDDAWFMLSKFWPAAAHRTHCIRPGHEWRMLQHARIDMPRRILSEAHPGRMMLGFCGALKITWFVARKSLLLSCNIKTGE